MMNDQREKEVIYLAPKTNVSITKKREAYKKANGVCFICGKKLSKKESEWSVDHFIPRAVYKWAPNEKVQNRIESGDNIFIVHPECNYSKDSALPTNKSINAMYAKEAIKAGIKELYRESEQSLVKYKAVKQSTLASQDRKCALCGKNISLNTATLRRKDNRKPRCRENAMCLCENCNIKAGNAHYKRAMVKKKKI